jgi:hypothetical protein
MIGAASGAAHRELDPTGRVGELLLAIFAVVIVPCPALRSEVVVVIFMIV